MRECVWGCVWESLLMCVAGCAGVCGILFHSSKGAWNKGKGSALSFVTRSPTSLSLPLSTSLSFSLTHSNSVSSLSPFPLHIFQPQAKSSSNCCWAVCEAEALMSYWQLGIRMKPSVCYAPLPSPHFPSAHCSPAAPSLLLLPACCVFEKGL